MKLIQDIVNEPFYAVEWPHVQKYMSHPDFKQVAVLINSGPLWKHLGNSAYLVPYYVIEKVDGE